MSDLEPAAAAQPLMPAWEYAPAPESKDIVRLQDRYGLFIAGEFVEPKSGRWFPTIDPSNEAVLAEVAEAGEEDVDVAVTAARSAYVTAWRDLPGSERAKYLYRIARELAGRAREIGGLESIKGGKAIEGWRDG